MKPRSLFLAAAVGLAACGGPGDAADSYLQGVGRIPGAQSVGVEVQAGDSTLTAPEVQGPVIGTKATGNRLIIIGDSILAGTANRYGGEMCTALVPLGWRVVVEAEAGQPASFGRDVLKARLAEGWDAAVVFLGTNPSSSIDRYEKDMTRIVESLAPRPVLLLTTTLFRDSQKVTNDVIRNVAASHDNVSVLDWGTTSLQEGVLNRDGVHPTGPGRALLVKAVAAAVGNAPPGEGKCLEARFADDSRVTGVLPSTTVAGIVPVSPTSAPTATAPGASTTVASAPISSTATPTTSTTIMTTTTTTVANPTTTTRP